MRNYARLIYIGSRRLAFETERLLSTAFYGRHKKQKKIRYRPPACSFHAEFYIQSQVASPRVFFILIIVNKFFYLT